MAKKNEIETVVDFHPQELFKNSALKTYSDWYTGRATKEELLTELKRWDLELDNVIAETIKVSELIKDMKKEIKNND